MIETLFYGMVLLTAGLALIGAGASIYSVRDAYLDFNAISTLRVGNGRVIIAKINLRSSYTRLAVFLLLSLTSYFAFEAVQARDEITILTAVIRSLQFLIVVLLSYDSHMAIRNRREVIELYEARMRAEQRAVRDTPPLPPVQ